MAKSKRSTLPGLRRRNHSSLAPSAGILSLLAVIASPETAGGSPLGPHYIPAFLCPSVDVGYTEHPTIPIAGPSTSVPLTKKSKRKRSSLRVAPRVVSQKFESGVDGLYRPATEFTYYGSTVCAHSSCSGTNIKPTYSASPSEEDNIAVTTPSPQPTPLLDVMNDLPPGWAVKDSKSGQTTLIIVLSLSLAFTIALFMIGCMFWRKQKRRSKGDRDVEMRQRRKRKEERADDEASILEKEMRVKQRMWARATARWKANVRQSARQRRSSRRMSGRHNRSHSSLSTRDGSPSGSRSHSRASSRRSSIASATAVVIVSSPSVNSLPLGESSNQTRPFVHLVITGPPAYNNGRRPSIVNSLPSADGSLQPKHSLARSRRPSDSFGQLHPVITDLEPYDQSLPASAHVATDDKNLLARLNDLVSAPPPGPSDGEGPSGISVPLWRDEEIEDFSSSTLPKQRLDCSRPSSPLSTSGLLFPPPPSKGQMSSYDYSYSYEDLSLDVEPDSGPSAPPFTPSAPPLDGASAPPFNASAPPLAEEWDEWDPEATLLAALQPTPSAPCPIDPAEIPLPPSPSTSTLPLPSPSSPPGYS